MGVYRLPSAGWMGAAWQAGEAVEGVAAGRGWEILVAGLLGTAQGLSGRRYLHSRGQWSWHLCSGRPEGGAQWQPGGWRSERPGLQWGPLAVEIGGWYTCRLWFVFLYEL